MAYDPMLATLGELRFLEKLDDRWIAGAPAISRDLPFFNDFSSCIAIPIIISPVEYPLLTG